MSNNKIKELENLKRLNNEKPETNNPGVNENGDLIVWAAGKPINLGKSELGPGLWHEDWYDTQIHNSVAYYINGKVVVERTGGELLFFYEPDAYQYVYDDMAPDEMLLEMSEFPEEDMPLLRLVRELDKQVSSGLDLRVTSCTVDDEGKVDRWIVYLPSTFGHFIMDFVDLDYVNETTVLDLFKLMYLHRRLPDALEVKVNEQGGVTVTDPDREEKMKNKFSEDGTVVYFEPRMAGKDF